MNAKLSTLNNSLDNSGYQTSFFKSLTNNQGLNDVGQTLGLTTSTTNHFSAFLPSMPSGKDFSYFILLIYALFR
jgi:hypothetical protein